MSLEPRNLPTDEATPTWLRDSRRALGWSMAKLADYIGVDRSTLWRWENGQTTMPYSAYRLIKQLLANLDNPQ